MTSTDLHASGNTFNEPRFLRSDGCRACDGLNLLGRVSHDTVGGSLTFSVEN